MYFKNMNDKLESPREVQKKKLESNREICNISFLRISKIFLHFEEDEKKKHKRDKPKQKGIKLFP
jgi:hypothetical protein